MEKEEGCLQFLDALMSIKSNKEIEFNVYRENINTNRFIINAS